MTSFPDPAAAGGVMERRLENLALVFQELLTVTVRLRANRQAVSDAESFRAHIKEALRVADQEARRRSYSAEDLRLAVFAVVAFLDESILNSQNPVFANWHRKPLQEELFGIHVAGEIFFQNLDRLLGRKDSHELADLLEIYQLCLLLGFRGKYGASGKGDLAAIANSIREKIGRIRRSSPLLSPSAGLPSEAVRAAASDPWVRRLAFAAAACAVIAVALFAGFKISLGSGAGDLRAMIVEPRR